MTDHAKRLAEIEALHREDERYETNYSRTHAHADRGVLLAEVKRLQTENEMLSSAMDQAAAKVREAGAASEVLDALGVAPGSLAERVKARGGDRVDIEDVVSLVYTMVDTAMCQGSEPMVRDVLRGLVGMPVTAMLAGLSASLPWAGRLREERAALAAAVRKADPGRAEELLRGLEP